MVHLLARMLPWFSIASSLAWLLITGICGYALATGSPTIDEIGAATVSGALAVAILLTTAVLVGAVGLGAPVDEEGSPGYTMVGFFAAELPVREGTHAVPRGPALLGVAAALAALLFVWFVPVWAGLFVWAIVASVMRIRRSDLMSPAMRVVVFVALGLFAAGMIVAGLLATTIQAVGMILWTSLGAMALALTAWHVELGVRATRRRAPHPPAPPV
ncbi:hypothetical protein P0L94_05190 [Microbacter sp. GSS18]|nr:hypothetical protein P0L94_05190 [Microbacter sp. GSS18]